jgi:uncharacterized protein involved in copper resistance
MHKYFPLLALIVPLVGGCVAMPPPANRSASHPSDAAAPESNIRPVQPNLVATTQVYLDPSVGRGAQKMDHSKMQGMSGMEGMDHSKMQGMGEKKQPSPQPNTQGMEDMDHSKMPGTQSSQSAPQREQSMQGMDHSKMPGMTPPAQGAAASPPSKEVLKTEMQKTSDEMKKLSDEMKEKTDAARAAEKSGGKANVPEGAPQAAVYTCPMHPEVKRSAPGNCPKCGMTLVKKSVAP